MRILLLGKTGQLGWELRRCLAPLGDVRAVDYPEIDLANHDHLRGFLRASSPNLIVNATAYTAVDRAEDESELAHAINAAGPGVLAEEAKALGAALIHYSTDYVFDGAKGAPYVETDAPNPLNVYGKSKLAGEQAIQSVGGAYLILRTAWVYSLRASAGSPRPDGFVSKVLQWARKNETLRVVDDQVSNPTWARALAETTALVIARDARGGDNLNASLQARAGLYHLAGDGYASRLEWAKAILAADPRREEQITRELLPARSDDFPTPAQRPLFSALDCSKFTQDFNLRLPNWAEALQLAMEAG